MMFVDLIKYTTKTIDIIVYLHCSIKTNNGNASFNFISCNTSLT